MALTDKQKKWIDIGQWVLILLLIAICVGSHYSRKLDEKQLIGAEYQREQTYIKIYESQQIEALRKTNKELADSVKKLKNAETAVEIRYKYKYSTDTIYSVQFVQEELNDSIYHYVADNDTVRLNIDVKAAQLDWVKSDFTINDKFRIINTEKDGFNQVFVEHSPNAEIEGLDVWHRDDRKKWYHNFHIGPSVSIGYGTINGNLDVFIGFGVTYNVW